MSVHRPVTLPLSRRRAARAIALLCALVLLPSASVRAEEAPPAGPAAKEGVAAGAPAETPDAKRLFDAIVKVETRAVPNARSKGTLGDEREGTGVVVGEGGLILTIGYLLVEADDVRIVDRRGHVLPAKIVGYDHATGLGLIRPAVPIDARPVPLGDSARLAERDPVMIVGSGGADDVTLAYVVSRREFTGSWEYLLDEAIFTSPPALNWSGAALIDRDGRLVGIGSLIVRDAAADDREVPGNMFVPIDVLKPVLDDLVKTGRRAGPARPWLGVATGEEHGRLFVTRVSPDGPADEAGIRAGDIILAVERDGVRTQAEFYRRLWARGAAGAVITLRVLQGIDVRELKVRSIDRVDYFRPPSTF
jgi:serine protease Do